MVYDEVVTKETLLDRAIFWVGDFPKKENFKVQFIELIRRRLVSNIVKYNIFELEDGWTFNANVFGTKIFHKVRYKSKSEASDAALLTCLEEYKKIARIIKYQDFIKQYLNS